jgi:hypothetical protein
MAHLKCFYAASASLWAVALAYEPRLAADLKNHPRYNDACANVLAGSGQGKDD